MTFKPWTQGFSKVDGLAEPGYIKRDPIRATRRDFLTGVGAATASYTLGMSNAHGSPLPRLSDWGGIELLDERDRAFKLCQLQQPLTLIIVWANWCSRCLRELATVKDLTQSKVHENLEVILVSHPDDWLVNQKIVAEHALAVRCARPSTANDPSDIRRAFVSDDGVFYVPHSLLFSRQQKTVVWNHIGAVNYASEAAMTPVRKWLPT